MPKCFCKREWYVNESVYVIAVMSLLFCEQVENFGKADPDYGARIAKLLNL